MIKLHNERGATLVVVLMLLLIISTVGIYAIRHSVLNLRLATNAQVQTLLMQTSDVALSHFERNFSMNEAQSLIDTPVGQVLLEGNEGKELQFCFKPTEVIGNGINENFFFNLADYRIIERASDASKNAATSASAGDIEAFCDPATMFSISRKALVTQVAVDNPEEPMAELSRFSLSTKNTDLKETNIDTKYIRVIVTTFAPALAPSVSVDDMKTCLKGRMMDDLIIKNKADSSVSRVKVETVHECLNNLGVPINTQVAEYVVNLSESRQIS